MLVGTFNQEKALLGAFSVIMKTDCETDGALHSTRPDHADVALCVDRVQGEHRGRIAGDSRGVKHLIYLRIYCHQFAYD